MAGADASDAHRGRAFATVAGGMSVSMVLGVPIGVLTGQWFGWRAAMWGIGAAGLLVALPIPSMPAVRVQSAGLRERLWVLVRPAVTKVLVVTVFDTVAIFTALVYLPLVVRPSATWTVLSWVFVAFGVGQVIGNTLAVRWTDRFGPDLVRLISLAGSAGTLVLLDLAVLSLPSTIAIALAAGTSGGMLMVPQQHRLFSKAPDAPTVALGLRIGDVRRWRTRLGGRRRDPRERRSRLARPRCRCSCFGRPRPRSHVAKPFAGAGRVIANADLFSPNASPWSGPSHKASGDPGSPRTTARMVRQAQPARTCSDSSAFRT
jgi:MFS family permease